MADNLDITPGTGKTIATDEVSGVHFQRVKLTTGADGSAEPIGDDDKGTSRALWVAPRGMTRKATITPTISATAYASGDVVGTPMEVTNAAREAGGTGIVLSAVLLDRSQAQRAAMDLVFFNDNPASTPADNAPFAVSDADMVKCCGVVPLGAYNTVWPGTPLNSIATTQNINLPYDCAATSLWVVAVVRGTPTYTLGDLSFTFGCLLD